MITTIGDKTLLEHQIVAVKWMIEQEKGGLLCDEMGLGKTLSVIGMCINMPKPLTLLLCPLAVVPQWIAALKDAGLTVYNFTGKEWLMCSKSANNDSLYYVSNTDKIIRTPSAFDDTWDRIIIDEAHQIRNFEGSKYQTIDALKRTTTWCLTATPIVNKLQDVSSLLHLVNNKINVKETKKSIVLGYMEIYAMARNVQQIREKIDIFPDSADTYTHMIDFINDEEKIFYRGVQGALKEELMNKIAQYDKNMNAIFEILLRLRQLSLHPQIYIDAKKKKHGALYVRKDWNGDSAKLNELVNLISSTATPHKWVIFCQFHGEMDIINERLQKETAIESIWEYHGQMKIEERNEIIEKTKKELTTKHQVLLLQIHCGGTGLNLQHMDRVVFTSPWWTAALMDQAVGRVMRIGQKNKVEIHHLKLKEGESMNIDDLIFSKVEQKRTLCNEVLASALNTMDLDDC
jgi:SNF2 family DNA or RNA helicase